MSKEVNQLDNFQSGQSLNIEKTVFDDYLNCDLQSSDTNEFQGYNNHRVQSSSICIPINQNDSLSMNMSNCQSNINDSVKSISLTYDQFQSLLNATNTIPNLLENSTIIGNNIPLRIVSQPNLINNRNRSIKSSHRNSRRKLSHNIIEKRYRSSINEKILELKEIVEDSNRKIQKSAILRRTVEYIRQLQLTNQRLKEENRTLKNILKQLNLTNVDFPTNNHLPSSISNNEEYIPVSKS